MILDTLELRRSGLSSRFAALGCMQGVGASRTKAELLVLGPEAWGIPAMVCRILVFTWPFDQLPQPPREELFNLLVICAFALALVSYTSNMLHNDIDSYLGPGIT